MIHQGLVSQVTAEVIILTMTALGAGILMFVAGVVQKIMDDMDEQEFKRFLNKLDKTAMTEPFAVTIATLPVIALVPYFVVYGFGDWWFTAGLAVWLLGGSVVKSTNMSVYSWVANPENKNPEGLRRQRRKLHLSNNARGWISLLSVVLMACQFGQIEVASAVAVGAMVAVPLLRLSRRYLPGTAPGTSA